MSHSLTEFEKINQIKTKLDSVSPSFCLVRWKHATLNLATGSSKSCCHHDFKPIDIKNTLDQLHDNPKEQTLRQKMIDGKRSKDCSYCWWVEDNKHNSDRQNWSAKSWMSPYFDEVTENLTNKASSPSWVELNFSSRCNMKCIYCSPIFSTKWYEEIKTHGPYPTLIPHNNIKNLNHLEFEEKYENKELLEKFWPWFKNNIESFRLLKITGGEPLLSNQTFKMLDLISEMKLPKLSFGINSNLNLPHQVWNSFLEKIKEIEKKNSVDRFYLHPSLDSFGERGEYIRTGLDMELFKSNVESYLEQTNSHLHLICTLNNLALGGLLEYWEYLLKIKKKFFKANREISLGTELLHAPEWLNINLLPPNMEAYLEEVIDFVEKNIDECGRGFLYVELEGLKKAKSTLFSKPKDEAAAKINFYRFIRELDIRRKSDFHKTFPELKDFYYSCEMLDLRNNMSQNDL